METGTLCCNPHNRFIPKIEPVTTELVDHLNVTTFPYSLLDSRSR